jgi:predicted phosphodiesterase
MQLDKSVKIEAGRFCPADYRIDQKLFAKSQATMEFDLVYVVGGLYGNTEALRVICDAFEADPVSNKCMIFNGDFHWFDVSAAEFLEIEFQTSKYMRLRGNVETELARDVKVGDEDVGCGCAYPDEVSSKEVDYSNAIIQQLRATYRQLCESGNLTTNLNELPMATRFQIGGVGVAVTHGDTDSLAGWNLAHHRIESTLADELAHKLDVLEVDVVASSHTCLPALHKSKGKLVANNGAAGLANFQGDTTGLITRIVRKSTDNAMNLKLPIAYQTDLVSNCGAVNVKALKVPFNNPAWQHKFIAQWPRESAAYESYWKRIQLGTSYTEKQAMQYEF